MGVSRRFSDLPSAQPGLFLPRGGSPRQAGYTLFRYCALPVWAGLALSVVFLVTVVSCGGGSPLPDADGLVTRARQAWEGDWHAVWQFEWAGAPVRGPLLAEVWHAADGRLRIETLEAPSPALDGLTLVADGTRTWLYDLRQDRIQTGSGESVTIPLASDAIEAMDWLFLKMEDAPRISVSGADTLESGMANRLHIALATGDRAVLWIDNETGLPSRVELNSAVWGEATFAARSINALERPHPDLFLLPPQEE